MFSSIYWYIFLLFMSSCSVFNSEKPILKGFYLTAIILFTLIIFKKLMPEINIHIHKGWGEV